MTAVSVIMTALNEEYTEKTVETILERSGDMLKEIIIVDDCGDDPLCFKLPKTTIYRQSQRRGLIKGRNLATEISTSDIVISVDPHVKVAEDWLPPIVDRINDNYRCVSVPLTTSLNPNTWQETGGFSTKTGWHWNLDFYWRDDDVSDETPCFSGHCFAYSKKWWVELGGFDRQMNKWGGENIEFSLKSWLCGGSVELVRDSSTAHWFKSGFNYSMDMATLQVNKARIAEVWFDDRKKLFYEAINKKPGDIKFGDVSDCQNIRRNMQIRPFEWFLSKFQPELTKIYNLKNKHVGARVAVVGAGPSLDNFDLSELDNFDVVIGVNYVGLMVDCTYVLFHDMKPAVAVLSSKRYDPECLLVPVQVKDGRGHNIRPSHLINPDWIVYKLGPQDKSKSIDNKDPPFLWHATSAHTAAHFAAFLGASSVTMIGCDGKLSSSGRSHTVRIPQYRRGNYWPKNKTTENFLRRMARGDEVLREAFKKWEIPLSKRLGTYE